MAIDWTPEKIESFKKTAKIHNVSLEWLVRTLCLSESEFKKEMKKLKNFQKGDTK